MQVGIKYDNIHLPKKVSEILEHDFWVIENVSPSMVKAVTSPVKISAYTSIFLTQGSCSADINLIKYRIQAPCIVNIPNTHIMQPYDVSEDFKASFIVLSKRMTDSITSAFNDVSIFGLIRRHPVVPLTPEIAGAMSALYSEIGRAHV